MLVVGRKKGDTVLLTVGEVRIVVTVTDDDPLKLGFTAPDDVKILRGELEERAVLVTDPGLLDDVGGRRDTLVLDLAGAGSEALRRLEALAARQSEAGGRIVFRNAPDWAAALTD